MNLLVFGKVAAVALASSYKPKSKDMCVLRIMLISCVINL